MKNKTNIIVAWSSCCVELINFRSEKTWMFSPLSLGCLFVCSSMQHRLGEFQAKFLRGGWRRKNMVQIQKFKHMRKAAIYEAARFSLTQGECCTLACTCTTEFQNTLAGNINPEVEQKPQ